MIANHHNVAEAVRGKREAVTGLVTCADVLDTRHRLELPHDLLDVNGRLKIGGGKRAEGAVMHDIGIGDGENDPRLTGSEPGAEELAQVNDLRLPQRVVFVVHAVICGDADDSSACVKRTKILIKPLMKAV